MFNHIVNLATIFCMGCRNKANLLFCATITLLVIMPEETLGATPNLLGWLGCSPRAQQ